LRGTFFGYGNSILKHWMLSYLLVLLIPVIGFFVMAATTRTIIIDEIINSRQQELYTIQTAIDNRLDQSRQIAATIILDSRFREVVRRGNTQNDIINTQEGLIELLLNYHQISGVDILVYMLDTDYIVTPTTAQESPLLSLALYHAGHNIITETWREKLSAYHESGQFISSPYLSYNRYGEDALVFFINVGRMPLTVSTNIFISLQHSSIANTLNLASNTELLILDNAGNVLMSFGGENTMQRLDITYAAGDIVNIDGVQYIRTIKQSSFYNLTYVMLMPYHQFWRPYHLFLTVAVVCVLAALVVGLIVSAYLLRRNYRPLHSVLDVMESEKPKGNEFEIIRDHLIKLTKKHHSTERFLLENYLYALLTDKKRYLSDDDVIESLGLNFDARLLVPVCAFALDLQDSMLEDERISLSFVIDNVFEEMFDNRFEYLATETESAVVFMFVLEEDTAREFENMIDSVAGDLCEFFLQNFSLRLNMVIGRAVESTDEIYISYKEVLEAHVYQRTMEGTTVMRSSQKESEATLNFDLSLLYEAVQYKKTSDAVNMLERLFPELEDKPFQLVRFHIFAIADKLCGIEEAEESKAVYDALNELLTCANQLELKVSLTSLIHLICGETPDLYQKEDSLSSRIESFISDNYADFNLNISTIADQMGLSAKYISKIFKMQVGYGLLNYINFIRIQKAKELINAGGKSINDIALEVGYSNQRTFRRAFQRVEGINPSEYLSGGKLS